MDIKEKINIKERKYLRDKDLKSLDLYVYHGADYTLVENLLNPFWNWFASFFPDWMAPNTITLIGLIINIISAALVLIHDPTLEGKAPSYYYIIASISLITYLNFDCADGKQARRLQASSPLGQLFDHGCDAVNEVFILLVLASACGTGFTYHTSLVLIIQCCAFSLAQVLEYYIDLLVVGNKFFGTTESILVVSITYFLSGVLGVSALQSPLPSWLSRYLPIELTVVELILLLSDISMIVTIFQLWLSGLLSGSLVDPENRGEKNLTTSDYMQRMIPSLYVEVFYKLFIHRMIAFCSAYLLIFSELKKDHYILLYCIFTIVEVFLRCSLLRLYQLVLIDSSEYFPSLS